MPERYPLSWPERWPRAPAGSRTRAHFGKTRTLFDGGTGRYLYAGKSWLSVADALSRIADELARHGVPEHTVIVSTNVRTRIDGLPRSGEAEPADPGVAVYWTRRGKKQCMAVDRYTRVADNLAAIAATLEAFRAIDRHGGAEILDRSFAGFAQLPASIVTARPWREVLKIQRGGPKADLLEAVESQFRDLAKQVHPDVIGGDNDRMVELNQARAAAMAEIEES